MLAWKGRACDRYGARATPRRRSTNGNGWA